MSTQFDDNDQLDDLDNADQGDDNQGAADNDTDADSQSGDRENDNDDFDQDDDSGASNDQAADDNDSDDDSDDEDVDEDLDYRQPVFETGSAQTTEPGEFDINNLPKDENGYIDPIKANKMIAEHYAKANQSQSESQKVQQQNKELLTRQWLRGKEKFPAVYKDPELRKLARDRHLNSIGTGEYLTPVQAMKQADNMRKRIAKGGYKSARTRKSVESMTRTSTNRGRNQSTQPSEYAKAQKMAASSDKTTAREGRLAILRMRREARSK